MAASQQQRPRQAPPHNTTEKEQLCLSGSPVEEQENHFQVSLSRFYLSSPWPKQGHMFTSKAMDYKISLD